MPDGAHSHASYDEAFAAVNRRLDTNERDLADAEVGFELLVARLAAVEELVLNGTPPPPPPDPDPEPEPEPVPPVAGIEALFLKPFPNGPWYDRAPTILEPVSGPRTQAMRKDPAGDTGINVTRGSVKVYLAKLSDPLISIVDVKHSNLTVQVRVPVGAVPDVGSDGCMWIAQPDGTYVDLWIAKWVNPTRIDTMRLGRGRLDGPGMGPAVRDPATGEFVPAGVRATGGPWPAGMIRRHEIEAGVIPHAIPIALPVERMLYTSSHYGENSGEHIYGVRGEQSGPVGFGNQRGYVSPATEQDWNGRWVYKGPIPMGQRFVIPRSVDLASLGLNPAALMLAKAAQDYGVVVCDTTQGGDLWVTFYAENDPALNAWAGQAYANRQLATIRRALVAVA
jgi:hypothetical protein